MSRKECAHGSACGHDLCPCDDPSGLILECNEFEDSGWRPPRPRDPQKVAAILAEKERLFHEFKHGVGFRFGEGKVAQAEARRRRDEIAALRRELRW